VFKSFDVTSLMTTGTSSYYMDENHSAGSEIQRPQYGRHSWPGSEPSTLEIDVYVRCYALLVVLARNDDDGFDVEVCLSRVLSLDSLHVDDWLLLLVLVWTCHVRSVSSLSSSRRARMQQWGGWLMNIGRPSLSSSNSHCSSNTSCYEVSPQFC